MNSENPVQIDLFGVSATRTKDTRLGEHIDSSLFVVSRGWKEAASPPLCFLAWTGRSGI